MAIEKAERVESVKSADWEWTWGAAEHKEPALVDNAKKEHEAWFGVVTMMSMLTDCHRSIIGHAAGNEHDAEWNRHQQEVLDQMVLLLIGQLYKWVSAWREGGYWWSVYFGSWSES